MTLPTFVAVGTAGDGVTSATPGLPAGVQENDVLLLFAETDDHEVQAAGYEEAARAGVGTSTRLTTFWRRAGASEVTHAVGDGLYLNGAVTTLPNCLVVGLIGRGLDAAGAAFSGWTNADLANLTERFDDGTTTGSGGGIGIATGEKAAAGAFRETTLTDDLASLPWLGMQLALAPSGGSLPTFVATGTAGDGVASAAPGLPAGTQENDILLLPVKWRAGSISVDQGYVELPGSPIIFGSANFSIYWKRATSSESAPTVTGAGTNHVYAVLGGFRGVTLGSVPWNVLSSASFGTAKVPGLEHVYAVVAAVRGCKTHGVPWNLITPDSSGVGAAITLLGTAMGSPTTVKDCLVVGTCSHSNDVSGPTFSGWTNADLANLTERFDDGTTTGNGGGLAVVTGEKAIAGAFGDTTATNSTVNPGWAGYHIALAPGGPRHLPRLGVGR